MLHMQDKYNEHSSSQRAVFEQAEPLFQQALHELSSRSAQNSGSVLRVADLGCSTGRNSIAPLQTVACHATASGYASMSVLLSDLPTTDWRTTALTVTPELLLSDCSEQAGGAGVSASGSPSKKRRLPAAPERQSASGMCMGVFVHLCGRSFYEQVAPDGSLDLSYSLVATHWMSKNLGPVLSGCYATDPLHVPDAEVRGRWKALGAADWGTFVACRAKELAEGGKLIASVSAPHLNGDFPWSRAVHAFYMALQHELTRAPAEEQGQEEEDGRLTEAELADFIVPSCIRDRAEVEAPFLLPSAPFRVDALEFAVTKCVHREALRAGAITLQQYGSRIMDSVLAVIGPVFLSSLREGSTASGRGEKIMSKARVRAEEIVRSDPDTYHLAQPNWLLLATRVAPSAASCK
mmetsp:Transcript_61083/g.145524  ORF Transcript_61083/g.145524 Transcript_61083/m.145524 type:complete len:407 (-) Transcript_61083:84-1304(-)